MAKILCVILMTLTTAVSTARQVEQSQAKNASLSFIRINRNGHQIDTTYKHLNSIAFKDSIYYLTYTTLDADGDITRTSYELPISNSQRTKRLLLDSTDYRLKYKGLMYLKYDKQYTAYKFLFDDPNADDEEMNYYFIPEFGVVIFRFRAWGGYERLINNGQQDDFDRLFYLTEKIVSDFNGFYHPTDE
ncbi:MAG: hypothetical protein RIG68_17435 [Imperialibacter sp.]|uniref:hypothetical protein n=1 Tax=Imperialibacter sp. TaxID=2038411 RepID=UPI0032EBD4A3